MSNQPRDDNPARAIRVGDPLWHQSRVKAKALGIPVAWPVREALRALVRGDFDDFDWTPVERTTPNPTEESTS